MWPPASPLQPPFRGQRPASSPDPTTLVGEWRCEHDDSGGFGHEFAGSGEWRSDHNGGGERQRRPQQVLLDLSFSPCASRGSSSPRCMTTSSGFAPLELKDARAIVTSTGTTRVRGTMVPTVTGARLRCGSLRAHDRMKRRTWPKKSWQI